MNTPSLLIGPAGLEWEGDSANTADDASSRDVAGRACHSIVLLADYGD